MASEHQLQLAQSAAACLDAFFAAPNLFVLPAARHDDTGEPNTNGVPEALVSAIQRTRKGEADLPMLLPFRSAADERVTWYACARDKQGERAVRADLDAFVGPGFADFDISTVPPKDADDLFTKHGFHAVRFTANRPKFDMQIVEQWCVYWELLQRKPKRRKLEHRTFAQLRAALDWALLAKNEAEASAAVAALREQHGLSAENRAFLDIRIAASFGRWDEILDHENFSHLLKLRLPPETFGDIWEALYETCIRPHEASGDPERLKKAFETQVRPAAGHLLRSLGRSRRPAALKSFVLHELSQTRPAVDLCAQWLAELGDHAFGPATAGIVRLIEALTPRNGFDVACEDMNLERYEQAYDLLSSLEDSVDVLIALLRCSKEIDDPERAVQTIARLGASDPAVAAEVRKTRTRLLGDVTRLAETFPPQDLKAQLLDEAEREPAAADNVVEFWRELANADALIKIDDAMQQRLLQSMEDEVLSNSGTFDALLPVWFDWIVERTRPHVPFIPLYDQLLDTIWVRDRYGESELELIKQAALHVVRAGPTPEQYRHLMERLKKMFDVVRSPHSMPWALDLADSLAMSPSRDDQARNHLLVAILSAGSEFSARLADAQKALLRLLASENSIPFTLPSQEVVRSVEPETTDSEARVMIYSLDSQATQRAMDMLKTLSPKLKVTTNCDTECTPRLRQSTRHADFVFFVSSVATHQAFFCIKDALRTPDALCHVQGTGTTRIVETVMKQIQAAG
ncbi:protein DpdD [Paraburkholderia caribensis]|uniref:protein DpdD n=1 Tax=Paraburkholderia caribensis TaxID=75105 RepID=UPI0007226ABF|nr:protein DpdD [Paraburkholderia caribensis]ALP61337.1 hypothetical protein AN416_01180 [Paraburkholderia caribensis]AUT50538.1 hypothetical protein C2L66_00855 [Paraburkholderia caribensis]